MRFRALGDATRLSHWNIYCVLHDHRESFLVPHRTNSRWMLRSILFNERQLSEPALSIMIASVSIKQAEQIIKHAIILAFCGETYISLDEISGGYLTWKHRDIA